LKRRECTRRLVVEHDHHLFAKKKEKKRKKRKEKKRKERTRSLITILSGEPLTAAPYFSSTLYA
jgi:hypothetical protein